MTHPAPEQAAARRAPLNLPATGLLLLCTAALFWPAIR